MSVQGSRVTLALLRRNQLICWDQLFLHSAAPLSAQRSDSLHSFPPANKAPVSSFLKPAFPSNYSLPFRFRKAENAFTLKNRTASPALLHSTSLSSISIRNYSTQGPIAQKIDGKVESQKIKDALKEEILNVQEKHPDFLPGLAIVQVGDRSDSNVYIKHKLKAAEVCGVKADHHKLAASITETELIKFLDDLNANSAVHGIIVQLPLDTTQTINTDTVIDRISPDKDVDGLTRANAGRLARGELDNTIIPCTPRGCLHLVQSTGTEVKGKRVVVLGRSRIVGFPAAALFLWNHATVTICHSRTVNLPEVTKEADILIVAVGMAQMVTDTWVKKGAVVIDCGINVLKGQGPNGKDKLVGDVHDSVFSVASHMTPVPGGVGPMTVAMLLKNTVDQARKALE